MRVAFLTHEPFHPPSGGGSAEAVYLVRELARRGHEVHLFCPAFDGEERVAADFGIRVHAFTGWRMGRYARLRTVKYLLYPWFLERLVMRQARTTPFQMILAQHAIASVTGGRLKKRLGVPVVMNFLDYLTGFLETWPSTIAPADLVSALERFEVSLPVRYRADGVMTVSDTLADCFAKAGCPRTRLKPIYYGYDADRFRLPPDHARAAGGPPALVMHGSFDRHHLGNIARTALWRVHASRPEVWCRLVGRRTTSLESFCHQVRAGAPNFRIECTGFVPYGEVADRLTDATVGIVPYEESTGTHCAFVAKIVEYLGVGLPVVSTPLRSATRYFENEPAIKFASFDGESFGDAILQWLVEPAARRRELGAAASQRVASELDWDVICRKAVDFIEQVGRR